MEFTYPVHVSAGSRDLIDKLLKHNPLHRLPIQGVLAHPWVVEKSTKTPTAMSHSPEQNKWGPLVMVFSWILVGWFPAPTQYCGHGRVHLGHITRVIVIGLLQLLFSLLSNEHAVCLMPWLYCSLLWITWLSSLTVSSSGILMPFCNFCLFLWHFIFVNIWLFC